MKVSWARWLNVIWHRMPQIRLLGILENQHFSPAMEKGTKLYLHSSFLLHSHLWSSAPRREEGHMKGKHQDAVSWDAEVQEERGSGSCAECCHRSTCPNMPSRNNPAEICYLLVFKAFFVKEFCTSRIWMSSLQMILTNNTSIKYLWQNVKKLWVFHLAVAVERGLQMYSFQDL